MDKLLPEDLNELLIRACVDGQLAVVKDCIKRGAKVDAVHNGRTALHYACGNNHREIPEFLLKNGASIDAITQDTFCTPLQIAALMGFSHIARILIENHANLEVRTKRQETPLFLAIACGKINVARRLIAAGARVKRRVQGQSLLRYACNEKSVGGVSFIVGNEKLRKILLERRDGEGGFTPLHTACTRRSLEIIRILVEGAHADVNATSFGGQTPLHFACGVHCAPGDVDCVAYLLQSGAKCDVSLLFSMHDSRRHEITRLLFKSIFAQMTIPERGKLAAMICRTRRSGMLRFARKSDFGFATTATIPLVDETARGERLQRTSFRVISRTAMSEDQPLSICKESVEPIVSFRREHGEAIGMGEISCIDDVRDEVGNSLLHIACELGDKVAVARLLEMGANFGCKSLNDVSVFRHLVSLPNANIHIARMLLRVSANIFFYNNEDSPIARACFAGNSKIARMILCAADETCSDGFNLTFAWDRLHIDRCGFIDDYARPRAIAFTQGISEISSPLAYLREVPHIADYIFDLAMPRFLQREVVLM